MVQMLFSNKDGIFQEDNSPTHTQLEVYKSWFQEHEDAFRLTLPDLSSNHCGQFLESTVRSRFPSPLSLKQLGVLREDWYNILLGTI